jgi:hypothetical protein
MQNQAIKHSIFLDFYPNYFLFVTYEQKKVSKTPLRTYS